MIKTGLVKLIYLLVILIVSALLFATVLVHYFILRQMTNHINHHASKPGLVIAIVMALFFAHSVEVLIYAIFYFVAANFPVIGYVSGVDTNSFFSAIYLSLLSFSSLGFSDLQLFGGFRLIAGFEALNGLLLVTWSASFTFLAMGKLWHCDSTGFGFVATVSFDQGDEKSATNQK